MRWKKYLYSESRLEQSEKNTNNSIERSAKRIKEEPDKLNMDFVLSTGISNGFHILTAFHLEYGCKKYSSSWAISHVKKQAIEYFYGDWRNRHEYVYGEILDRQKCREKLEWFDEYRMALLCAFLSDDMEFRNDVTKWAGEDLPFDDCVWNYTQQDHDFYILLGLYYQENQEAIVDKLSAKIEKGRARRAKACLKTFRAINEGNSKDFEGAIKAIHKLHYTSRRATYQHSDPLRTISIEASILWNLARYEGLKLPEFHEDIMDHIMQPETIQLEKSNNS